MANIVIIQSVESGGVDFGDRIEKTGPYTVTLIPDPALALLALFTKKIQADLILVHEHIGLPYPPEEMLDIHSILSLLKLREPDIPRVVVCDTKPAVDSFEAHLALSAAIETNLLAVKIESLTTSPELPAKLEIAPSGWDVRGGRSPEAPFVM